MSDAETHLEVPVTVAGHARQYAVRIGSGVLATVPDLVSTSHASGRVVVVADRAILSRYVDPMIDGFRRCGMDPAVFSLDADERAKILSTVERICAVAAAHGLERGEPMVAVGGGVIGDVTGYAAASFKRGVPFYNVPTTLLSMVDASVGGKTGVNLALNENTMIKNAVGAFHQPAAVVADVDVLQSLDDRTMRCGLAECIKHAIIRDPSMLEWIRHHGGRFRERSTEEQATFIRDNVAIKAAVVEADEREQRLRMVLNLGHTFAHAIETIDALALQHGEAVALGLIAASAAGESMGMTEPQTTDAIREAVDAVGLPSSISGLPDDAVLVERMRQDKKVGSGRIRLIIPCSVGNVEIVDDASLDAISAGWAAVRDPSNHVASGG